MNSSDYCTPPQPARASLTISGFSLGRFAPPRRASSTLAEAGAQAAADGTQMSKAMPCASAIAHRPALDRQVSRTASPRHLWMLLMILAAIAFAGSGCQSNPTGPGPTVHRGGTINEAIPSDPSSLLPGLDGSWASIIVDNALWAPLLYSDPAGKLRLGLLQKYEISPDGLTYTLTLRPSLKWSDGSPLTANDVKSTVEYYTSTASNSSWPSSEIASVTVCTSVTACPTVAPTPTTLFLTTVIKLKRADNTFLENALMNPDTFAPLPPSVIYALRNKSTPDPNVSPPVTSGAFTMTERVAGDHITVKRNPNYYQGPDKPYLDTINFRVITNGDVAVQSLEADAIDSGWDMPIKDLEMLKASPSARVSITYWYYRGALLNLKNPILADRTVRQAMAMSLDVTEAINAYWIGSAIPTCDDAVGTFAHEPDLVTNGRCYPLDVTKANQMLDADGWHMDPVDGYRHKDPFGRLELRYSGDRSSGYVSELTQLMDQVVQVAWKQIGLKIDVFNYTDLAASTYRNHDPSSWDIVDRNFAPWHDPDNHLRWDCDATFQHEGLNYGYYCNPDVDQLDDDQLHNPVTTPDQSTRTADFKEIHQHILQDIPLIYYYAPPTLSVANVQLHNYNPSPFGADTWNVWEWWLNR